MEILEKLKNLIGKPQIVDIPTNELFDVLSSKVLFEARWGFSKGNLSDEEYKSIIENKAKPALEMLKKQGESSPVIECKAVYGFFLDVLKQLDFIRYLRLGGSGSFFLFLLGELLGCFGCAVDGL